jgi:hypothetical protein
MEPKDIVVLIISLFTALGVFGVFWMNRFFGIPVTRCDSCGKWVPFWKLHKVEYPLAFALLCPECKEKVGK